MTPEDALRAAARTIGQMPEADIQRKFTQLQEARKARSQREFLRQQAEIDSLELDEAACQAGLKSEEDGDLKAAARWYHAAAVNDFPEASLRLAMILGAMAAEYRTEAESQPTKALIVEALEWYAKAFAAGEIEDDELIDELIVRLDSGRLRTQPAASAPANAGEAPADSSEPAEDQCALGGLRNVFTLDPVEMSKHCQSCQSCLTELAARLPGLVPIPR
jgi:TPR repeat protein